MAKEIERKFLIRDPSVLRTLKGVRMEQGYIATVRGVTVRVRVAGSRAYLTIKGRSDGISRDEYEYEVPVNDAEAMLRVLCESPTVKKVRYTFEYQGLVWELDEFSGENQGLLLAEVELSHPEQEVPLPDFVGPEVSGDPRYFNSYLVRNPYRSWKADSDA